LSREGSGESITTSPFDKLQRQGIEILPLDFSRDRIRRDANPILKMPLGRVGSIPKLSGEWKPCHRPAAAGAVRFEVPALNQSAPITEGST
jgi:hypothetical protein